MSQAELSTPRLRLRPRTMADLDACVAMDLDPEVHRFIYDDGPPDPIEHRAQLRAHRRGLAAAGGHLGGRMARRAGLSRLVRPVPARGDRADRDRLSLPAPRLGPGDRDRGRARRARPRLSHARLRSDRRGDPSGQLRLAARARKARPRGPRPRLSLPAMGELLHAQPGRVPGQGRPRAGAIEKRRGGGAMSERQAAVIVGVGPGLGFALVKRFARAGMAVALAARSKDRLDQLLAREPVDGARAYACDATEKAAVDRLFAEVERDLGAPDVVVFNAGAFRPGGILEIDPAEFEQCWRIGCFAGFLVGQAAARRMVARGRGTILFTGATAALRGSARFANLAVPK